MLQPGANSQKRAFTTRKGEPDVIQLNDRKARHDNFARTPWGVLRLPIYRLYRLDGAGRISGADWIEAADDEDARSKARSQSSCGG